MFNSLGDLRLFKFECANDLVIKMRFLQQRSIATTKEKSNPNRLDQMTEQNITET